VTDVSLEIFWELIIDPDSKGNSMLGGDMGFSGKIPPWLILLTFLILGIVLILAPHYWEWKWDYGIIPEVGVAFLVAAILGFTIDRWMKAELRTDAFLAAIGHILAPEFRAEVSRIIGYQLICERSHLLIEIAISRSNPNVVSVTSSAERLVRNKSSYPQSIKNIIHIDEWNYAIGRSKIIECSLTIDGSTVKPTTPPVSDDFSIQTATDEKQLNPDQIATLRSKWTEYKNMNDVTFFHFTIPTIDPEVEVRTPQEIDALIGFGTPTQNIQPFHYYPMRKKMVGTYFPHQSIHVRWWPKKTDGQPAGAKALLGEENQKPAS
jgi:hypothetical protein